MKIFKYFLVLGFLFLLLNGCATSQKLKSPQENPPAKQKQPESQQRAYSLYLDGALFDFQNQYEKALIEYYQALMFDSASAQINKSIARDLMRLQRYPAAILHLKKSLKYNPEDLETLNYLGEVYYNMKNYEQALIYYEWLFRETPYNTTVQNNLAFLYSTMKKNEKLLEFYGKLSVLYPTDVQRALKYAITALQLKKLDTARQTLNRIVEEDSTQLGALFVLGNLYEVENDTATAISIYHRVLNQDPADEDALHHLYQIYRGQEDWEEIAEIYSKYIEVDSNDSRGRLILGQAYFFMEEPENAKRVLLPVLDSDDFAPAALELLGRISFEKENLEEAQDYFSRLTAREPENRFGWIFLSMTYNQQQNYNESLKVLEEALRHMPKDADLLSMYGSTLNQAGQNQKALEPLEMAHQLNSEDLNTIVSLAAVYDQLQMWGKSDSLYEAALRKFPENALLLNNYSYSLSDRGIEMDKARLMSEKALEIEPDNSAYLDTMGWILYQNGNYEEARRYIQEALQGRENSAEVLEHMGDVYLKLNQPESARNYWQKALEIEPENAKLKQKLQSL
ncbi:MAG: tetratricopeptide repeat protein [Calditrichia bacterium]